MVLTTTTLSLADSQARLSRPVAPVSGQHERPPLDDRHSARRGTHRVVSRIDDDRRTVPVVDVAHRWDA
jgi:mRNA-degrading endonuclease RelE of RelBE toxin-antitoxin system